MRCDTCGESITEKMLIVRTQYGRVRHLGCAIEWEGEKCYDKAWLFPNGEKVSE